MQLLLSVPFRTTINLQARFVASRSEALVQALAAVAPRIAAPLPQLQIEVLQRHDDDRIGLYTSIDEDVLLPAVLPLFTLRWMLDAAERVLASAPAGVAAAQLDRLELHCFDHTVAIMELRLRLQGVADRDALAATLDKWSFTLAETWLASVHPVVLGLERELAAKGPQGQPPLSVAIAPEDAYFDRRSDAPRDARADLLWVSRVLVLPAPEPHLQWLRDWTQDRLSEDDRIPLGDSGSALRVGNSVVFGPWDEVAESALCKALWVCNRFYAVAHVLSTNQRLVHGQLLGERLGAAPAGVITQAIRSRVNLLQHEYEDALLGMQGLRKLAMEAYMRAWDFDKLLQTCERRLASVDVLVQSALQRRNLRYTRLVEGTLTLIGGLTLLDFAVSLMNFSRTPGLATDKLPGLTDLARVVPEDGLLYVLLGVILTIVYNKLRRK